MIMAMTTVSGHRDHHLPSDVMHDIFSRLPIKSLMRFRSVCKLWRELIDDPHLSTMHTRKDTVLLHHHAGAISAFTPHRSNDALVNLRAMLKLPEIKGCEVKAVGDGFLCLEDKGDKYIVNPITKEVLKLPKPPTEDKCVCGCAYGIGFDGSSETPKVVRLFLFSRRETFYKLGAEVYDFRERCWRRPRTSRVSLFPVREEDRYRAVSANGSIHWFQSNDMVSDDGGIHWFYNYDGQQRGLDPKIVSFDLRREEFSLLGRPKFKDAGSETRLLEVRGLLAMANHSLARHVEVWVLESSSKWTKRYKIEFAAFPENFKGCVTPRTVRCVGQIEGEMVLVNFTGRHCFSFYNPKQRRSSRGFDFEHVPHVRLPRIFAFTPTLISLHL